MPRLANIMEYVLSHYPHESELSNARLTKLLYLADWVHALRQGRQISQIDWYFDNYGPFVWDVLDTAKSNPKFTVEGTSTLHGNPKSLVKLKQPSSDSSCGLSDEERESVDHVIRETKNLNWDDFIKLVYSTHPIVSSERYSKLDLVEKAKEYQKPASV